MLTDVDLGKLKAPERMDVIWLEYKSMETDVASGKLKASEGMDGIWLEDKSIFWIELNFEIWLGISLRLL